MGRRLKAQQRSAEGLARARSRVGRGLFGFAGFKSNSDLFDRVTETQQKSTADREHYGLAAQHAGGVGGTEAAIKESARLRGGLLAAPPKPPRKPSKYVDPRDVIKKGQFPSGHARYAHAYDYAVQTGKRQRAILSAELGTEALAPSHFDALAKTGNQTYARNIAQWRALDAKYQEDSATAATHNEGFTEAKAAYDASQAEAANVTKKAGSGAKGGGGAGSGIGQGATSTSPGISFIKRPDTVWI